MMVLLALILYTPRGNYEEAAFNIYVSLNNCFDYEIIAKNMTWIIIQINS